MLKNTRLWLIALALGLAPCTAFAHGRQGAQCGPRGFPFKVTWNFQFDIHATACPQPTAPWWAYFPVDNHQMTPASGPTFPNWPAQFPPNVHPTSAPVAAPAAPNMVYVPAPLPVQPVGYYQAPPPSYWYGR
jgi:hypothetical protein